MREILFRGKRLDNGEWAFGSFGNHTSLDAMIIDRPYPDINGELSVLGFWLVDPSTVGQYAGLTDKNGVKIFEGDIVKDDSIHMIGTVIYAHGIYAINDVNDGFQEWNFWDECEVAGNIHDNPELLKKG